MSGRRFTRSRWTRSSGSSRISPSRWCRHSTSRCSSHSVAPWTRYRPATSRPTTTICAATSSGVVGRRSASNGRPCKCMRRLSSWIPALGWLGHGSPGCIPSSTCFTTIARKAGSRRPSEPSKEPSSCNQPCLRHTIPWGSTTSSVARITTGRSRSSPLRKRAGPTMARSSSLGPCCERGRASFETLASTSRRRSDSTRQPHR